MQIRQLREQHGYSVTTLAGMLGIARQSLMQWEDGRCYPSVSNLIKLAAIFDCSTDEILGRTADKKSDTL